MRKIFGRAGFFPLPLRERAGVRGILFSVVLIAGWLTVSGGVAVFGQNNSAPQPSNPQPNFFTVTPVTSTVVAPPQSSIDASAPKELLGKVWVKDPTRRKYLKNQIKEFSQKIEEYRQGKRDDWDGYVLMFMTLQDYGLLGLNQSPECLKLLTEWRALVKKHPDYQKRTSHEFSDQRKAREAWQKRQDEIKEKAKQPFVPKDERARRFCSGNRMAAIYQFRIEFYKLPSGVECHENSKGPWKMSDFYQFGLVHHGENIDLKPYKIITFGQNLSSSEFGQFPAANCDGTKKNCMLIAISAHGHGYGGSDEKEQEIINEMDKEGHPYKWHNPNADYQEFYGVITTDGKVLGSVPFHAHWPDMVIQPISIWPDGTALFALGKFVSDTGDDAEGGTVFADVKEVIVWSKKKGVQRMSADEAEKKFPELRSWRNWQWMRQPNGGQ